ncbi:MAG: hypothetical protein U1F57_07980 [bacterium]
MPYIKIEQREQLAKGKKPEDAGELNYQITRLLLEYLQEKGERYASYNEIMGVLQCVSQEFYRRWVVPYEDRKMKENGDVV